MTVDSKVTHPHIPVSRVITRGYIDFINGCYVFVEYIHRTIVELHNLNLKGMKIEVVSDWYDEKLKETRYEDFEGESEEDVGEESNGNGTSEDGDEGDENSTEETDEDADEDETDDTDRKQDTDGNVNFAKFFKNESEGFEPSDNDKRPYVNLSYGNIY